jgi:hypothetical protein
MNDKLNAPEMDAVLRYDIEENALKMKQLIDSKRLLAANIENPLTAHMSLARVNLPRDVRDKIIGFAYYKDKDTLKELKEIFKTLVGEYKFRRLMAMGESRFYDFMQKFIEILKLEEGTIRLDGCKCILNKFREIQEMQGLDRTAMYQKFMQASQECIDSEANPKMKTLENDLCEGLVEFLKDTVNQYPRISQKDFNKLINDNWWMFNDVIFVVLDALSKINKEKMHHDKFIKNLKLRELISEHQGGRKSRKRHYRNKRRVNTKKHSRHGKHHRRK